MKKIVVSKAVRIAIICSVFLLFLSVCPVSAEVVGAERIAFFGYSAGAVSSAAPGTTLTIPVIVSGFPRGLNQYAIEFTAVSPNLSLGDFTVMLDKSMIQISTPADPMEDGTSIKRRYLQTVKMSSYPDYGINETRIGTISVNLQAFPKDYDVVLSARIIESTSGAPLESLATPATGNLTIHVAGTTNASSTTASPFPFMGVLVSVGVVINSLIRRGLP